jgi:hypothetical protein
MAVHFCPAFTVISFPDEQVELGGSRYRIRRENGGVERISFRDEPDGFTRDHGMPLQFLRGVGRSGEGNDILAGQVVEQVSGRTQHELQRSLGQYAGLNDRPHEFMGEVGRDGGGLGDDGNARE